MPKKLHRFEPQVSLSSAASFFSFTMLTQRTRLERSYQYGLCLFSLHEIEKLRQPCGDTGNLTLSELTAPLVS
ncbi:hypothetical protein TSUD_301280 [Trifolium subterraneum]|uniref:Uncharacterized protein n=1 Tax=Trifolium subterraneum TaxID=3900 RepID=A0A1B5Z7C6_TRISU|nr:hypothetical protein TSUD_301280 [Trifolium subterraneum]